jgi:3-keto-L-gulonate-6-phosphate decarboxylase
VQLAAEVAVAAVRAGADFIEIGDPLIKAAGLGAVETIKRCVPETTVVAEMMSADWGRDQVESAVERGADAVLLIGPAAVASVTAAVEAGRRLDTIILLDVPAAHATRTWIRDMERTGIDGFVVTTNIDLGVGVHPPLSRVRAVRACTSLPIAVSGGFSATDRAILGDNDWDIMIVGRGVSESVWPEAATEQVVAMVRRLKDREQT